MRTLAAIALLALGGCFYDRPNPWKTAGDVEDLQDKTEADYALLVQEPFRPPQDPGPAFTDADLEAFRDTVLANADPSALQEMRAKSSTKYAWLQARQADLLTQDDLNRREQLRRVNEQIRIEWLRGRMIQARLDQVGGRR